MAYFTLSNFLSGCVASDGKMTLPVLDSVFMTRHNLSEGDSVSFVRRLTSSLLVGKVLPLLLIPRGDG